MKAKPELDFNVMEKRLESAVLTLKEHWDRSSIIWHLLIATILIALAGAVTPCCNVGPYRVCVINFAQGLALAFAIIGGPAYSLSAALGLTSFYMAEMPLLGCDDWLYLSVMSSGLIFCISWLMWKLDIRGDKFTFFGQLTTFVIIGFAMLITSGGFIYITGAELGVVDYPLSQCSLLIQRQVTFQYLVSIILGDMVCFAVLQMLYRLDALRVYGFLRSAIFMTVGVAGTMMLFNTQLKAEVKADLTLMENQGFSVRHELEYNLNLQLRALRDMEYWVVAEYSGLFDVNTASKALAEDAIASRPWVFSECIVAIPEEKLQEKFPGAEPARKLKHRYEVRSVEAYNDISRKINLPSVGTLIDEDSLFGQRLVEIENPFYNNRSEMGRQIYFHQEPGGHLVMVRPCYIRDNMVGAVVVDMMAVDFVRRSMRNVDLEGIGLRVSYQSDFSNPAAEMVGLYDYNYENSCPFLYSLPLGLGGNYAPRAIVIDLSYSPCNGYFLLHCLESSSVYLLSLSFLTMMFNLLMNQYALIEGKAHKQVAELDQKEQYYASVADAMSNVLMTISTDGRILSANEAAEQFFGLKEHEVCGKEFHQLIHHGYDCLNDLSCEYGQYLSGLQQLLREDGLSAKKYERRLRSFAVNSRDTVENHEGIYTLMRDENGGYAVLMIWRNIDAEVNLQKVRSEYIGTLSHAMRTPLSCIKGTVDLFSQFATKMIDANGFSPKGLEMLELGRRNITRLLRLVGDVLLCDSVENNTLHLEKTIQDVAPIVERAVESIKDEAEERLVTVWVTGVKGRANVDELRLEQILSNLISNAIKYSPEGSDVFVSATLSEDKKSVLFAVQDKGAGIPKNKQAIIFNRYAIEGAEALRKQGSLGLGLTICRGLVHAHGGEIWVDSKPGRGSIFKFTIPTV